MSEPPINVYGAVVVSEEWFDWARASLAQADALAAAVEAAFEDHGQVRGCMLCSRAFDALLAYRAARGGA